MPCGVEYRIDYLPHARTVTVAGAGQALHIDRPDSFVSIVGAAVDTRKSRADMAE
jgi:hypothetical protein